MTVTLNKSQRGPAVNALKSYAKSVSGFYGQKVLTLARQVARNGRVASPRTLLRALQVRSLEVSGFYALKLGSLYNVVEGRC